VSNKSRARSAPNPGWFPMGRSGNLKGRPRSSCVPTGSAFELLVEKTLTVADSGGTRDITVEEALQQRTYKDAWRGSAGPCARRAESRIWVATASPWLGALCELAPDRFKDFWRKACRDMNNAKAREAGRKARTARADAQAAELAPTIEALRAAGITTLRGIAAALNERGIPTARGRGKWEATKVRRVLARLGARRLRCEGWRERNRHEIILRTPWAGLVPATNVGAHRCQSSPVARCRRAH
jgi:hypothetical protein